jgi:kumamolisin
MALRRTKGAKREQSHKPRHAASGGADFLPPDAPLILTLYLRHRPQARRPGSGIDLAELSHRVSHEELEAERRRILRSPVAQVRRFAERHNMTVLDVDFQRRAVRLGVKTADAERAFATRLRQIEHAGQICHYPTRTPRLPPQLSKIAHSVLGLDTRQRLLELRSHTGADGNDGLYPSQIARLYGMTTAGHGAGQCVAIIEPAGGYARADVAAACRAMNVAEPQIIDVNVGNGGNRPGPNAKADREVALDIQVVAGVAPEARIAVYFTETSEPGLVAGVLEAVHDTVNRPNVIVITWGEPEVFWPPDARKAFDAVLHDAMRLGITVVATAGDDLARERMIDGKVHVNFPASNPYVLGCGGTRITLDAPRAAIVGEVVWNEGRRGTGGGISDVYVVPAFQSGVNLPASLNDGKRRRGVPDVAAAAAETNGYRIFLGGDEFVAGGTSAVAPLWGAFVALLNEQRGLSLGFINPRLYANQQLLKPITSGNNADEDSHMGYSAANGWSACTGLGSPDGAAIVRALTAVA